MNGSHSISIAVLSEDQDDVELINSTLRGAGLAAHCHWIDKPKKITDSLSDESVELIILNCDRFDDSIREVIKRKDYVNPEVPVIAIAAKADEKAIQDAMR
ncbi:MAG: hypothetical protein ACE5F8_08540, partial [Woeseiaceae bacterium]